MALVVKILDTTTYMNFMFIFNDEEMEKFRGRFDNNMNDDLKNPKKWIDVLLSDVMTRFLQLSDDDKNDVENRITKATIDCLANFALSFEHVTNSNVEWVEIVKLNNNGEYSVLVLNKMLLRS